VTKKRYSIETFKGIQPLYDVLRLAQGIFLAHAFASECFFQHRQNKDMAKLRSMVDDSLSLASLRFGSRGIFISVSLSRFQLIPTRCRKNR